MELGKIERAFMNNIVRRWFLRNLEARVFYRYLIKRNVIVYNPDAILEIGCGRGDGIAIHEKFYHPKIHHAFDIDQKLVALALRNINNSDFEHVKIYRCDVRAIKEPDETFDIVFGYGVLHHTKNWKVGLKEISRVLKPHGVYCWEEPFEYFNNLFISKLLLSHPNVAMTYKNWMKELKRVTLECCWGWPIKNPIITLGVSVKK
ncbi:MAG: class I SAM-dependent methyltransferase [Promethearchaeota archaeon]